MPRFVILIHDHPAPHWDLFLESGPVLRAWRIHPLVAGGVVPAESAADHRLFYLDYEGPVSGDRGMVSRVDAGTFTWEHVSDSHVIVRLCGDRFRGRLTMDSETAAWDPEALGTEY